MLQFVPCDLCGEERPELRYKIHKLNRQIVKYTKCGLLYVNPQNQQNLTYDFEDREEKKSKYQRIRDLAAKRHDFCVKQKKNWGALHFTDRADKVRGFFASGRSLDSWI